MKKQALCREQVPVTNDDFHKNFQRKSKNEELKYKRALCSEGDVFPPSNLYFCASGIPDRPTGPFFK